MFAADASGTPDLTFSWDFGDGNTSTVEDPTHVYAAPGTYTVTLEVITADPMPQSATATQQVTVTAATLTLDALTLTQLDNLTLAELDAMGLE